MKLINIGFGNMVSANRLVAIVSPESAPIKRIITEARERGMLITAGSDDHGAFGKNHHGLTYYMGAVRVDLSQLVLKELLESE